MMSKTKNDSTDVLIDFLKDDHIGENSLRQIEKIHQQETHYNNVVNGRWN